MSWKEHIQGFDERRDIVIPGDKNATLSFCLSHFIEIANGSLKEQGYFAAALSGGSTPYSIYKGLSENPGEIDWSQTLLFWGDERSVSPEDPQNNYHMAMEAGLNTLPIHPDHLFRMQAEEKIEIHAKEYEQLIQAKIPSQSFDLVMLGMGEDGHTASLFPKTHGLHAANRLAVANFVPQLNTWRMTLTFECINQAKHIAIYVMGKNKAKMVREIFTAPYDPDRYPIQKIGTPEHRALWILDQDAAGDLLHL